jgi:hypothetical protein
LSKPTPWVRSWMVVLDGEEVVAGQQSLVEMG